MSCWSLFVLLLLCVTRVLNNKWIKGTVHRGFENCWLNMYAELPTESTIISRIMCEWACYNDGKCKSVTYNEADHSCCQFQLNRPCTYVYTGSNVSMVTLMRHHAPVMPIRSFTVDLNNWTNVTAEELCNKLGTRLLSFDEMEQLATQGFGDQECGMIANGVGVIARNNTLSNCTFNITFAWCKGQ